MAKKNYYGAEVVVFPRSRLSHKAAMEAVTKPFMNYIEMFGLERATGFLDELRKIVDEMEERKPS